MKKRSKQNSFIFHSDIPELQKRSWNLRIYELQQSIIYHLKGTSSKTISNIKCFRNVGWSSCHQKLIKLLKHGMSRNKIFLIVTFYIPLKSSWENEPFVIFFRSICWNFIHLNKIKKQLTKILDRLSFQFHYFRFKFVRLFSFRLTLFRTLVFDGFLTPLEMINANL